MWAIRFTMLAVLGVMVGVFGYLLKNRKKYERVLEDRIVNLGLVIAYQLFCYLMVVLPSAKNGIFSTTFLLDPLVRFGFTVMGCVLICSGIVLSAVTVSQRKTLGGQDVKEGLITSGAYRYFRHPIYTGTIWISLGLALVMKNPDGLLMFPAVLGINMAEAILEERYDMGVRFREQYQAYKQTTRMFGPIWLWSILVVIIPLIGIMGTVIPDRP